MDLLIKNARIVTGDLSNMDAGSGNIGITNGKISYIGSEEQSAREIIDAKGMIVMPGINNAHSHSSMILMRNMVVDKPLENWLEESIFPIEAKMNREHIYNGSMLALAEMIKSGTTAFLDMYFEVDIMAEAALEVGMRANISLGLLTSRETGNDMKKAVSEWKAFDNKYNGAGEGLLNTSLEVHSVYLYEEKGLRESADFAMDTGTMIHAHLHETEMEVRNCLEKYGSTPVRVFQKCGLLEPDITAAHTVWFDSEDIDILKDYNVRPVHCPASNMFLASGFAPVPEMLEKGIKVALGTDGAASNNDLDMFGEIRLAGLIHKGSTLDATSVNAGQVINMATLNGAEALGFRDTGTIAIGMKADMILIDTNTPHNTPMLNPVNALVYSTKGADVDTVIVNGKILMRNKELKTIDEEKVIFNANKSVKTLLNI